MENNYVEETKEKVSKNYRNLYIIIVIIVLLVLALGGTFAYFYNTANNNSLTGDMANVNLELTVTKVLPETEGVDDIIVINFNELAASLNDKCVYEDDNDYALCQLYKINLANNSNGLSTNVKGSISFDNETAPNLSWIVVDNYSASTTYTASTLGSEFNTANATFTSFVDNYLLASGDNVDFYILVWVNESEDEQTDEGSYGGTVKFEDANGKGVTATFNS